MKRLLVILLVLAALPVHADHRHISIESRPGVSLDFYYLKQEGARATVVLLPGGKGTLRITNGIPTSDDFLVRSRKYFYDSGFNVAIIDKAEDAEELDFRSRTRPDHIEDIKKVTEYVREDTKLPVWLVGTSRGTISATTAAVVLGKGVLNGIVLTSSITSPWTPGAVPSQELKEINIPVLVVHHTHDQCRICDPGRVPLIIEGLTKSPAKKLVFLDGGDDPEGNKCGPDHWHGFSGIEKEAVDLIAAWIENPKP